MWFVRASSVVALAAGLAAPAGAGGAIAVGHDVPAFVLERPGGGEYTRASFPKRPMVLNVYASWCASCRREEANLVDAFRRYGDRVSFLGVDEQEGESTATAFAKTMNVTYPIALDDGQFAATFGTSKIPETVFIDAAGVVRAVRLGGMSASELESALVTIVPHEGGPT